MDFLRERDYHSTNLLIFNIASYNHWNLFYLVPQFQFNIHSVHYQSHGSGILQYLSINPINIFTIWKIPNFNKKILITSIIKIKKLKIQPRLLLSAGYNVTSLQCHATQSFLSFFSAACIFRKYRPEISVKWVIILELPLYIFLYMNLLQSQIFQFNNKHIFTKLKTNSIEYVKIQACSQSCSQLPGDRS